MENTLNIVDAETLFTKAVKDLKAPVDNMDNCFDQVDTSVFNVSTEVEEIRYWFNQLRAKVNMIKDQK